MAECPARRCPDSRWPPEAATPLRRARHAVSPRAPPGLLPSRPLLSRSPVPAATVAHRAVTDGAGISACHGPPTTVGHRAMTVRCPGRSRRVAARRGTGNTAAWSGYARTRQATAQVADEEVVVRTDSRHGSSRPDRARGGTRPSGPPRPGGRRDVDPAVLERLLEPIVRAAGLDLESVRVGSAG